MNAVSQSIGRLYTYTCLQRELVVIPGVEK
jgi:hypothetical protein